MEEFSKEFKNVMLGLGNVVELQMSRCGGRASNLEEFSKACN